MRDAAVVFIDRDGVINRAVVRGGRPSPPASLEELEILPGVAEALARLRAQGYRLVVVTNQPDIARGATTTTEVARINDAVRERLGLDDIRVCPHDDADACPCRKPKPGLLLRDAFDGPSSVMIGDRWRDIEAGRAAGCGATILVDSQYDEPVPREPDARVRSLAEAVDWILGRDRRPPAKAPQIS